MRGVRWAVIIMAFCLTPTLGYPAPVGQNKTPPVGESTAGISRAGIVTADFSCLSGRILQMESGWHYAGYDEKAVVVNVPGPSLAKKYGIYRDLGEIRHPATRQVLGHLIADVGVLRLVDLEADRQAAIIERSFTEVKVGDLLGPVAAFPTIPAQNPVAGAPRVSGSVVAVQDLRTLAVSPDVIYLDIGREQGLAPGDRFFVRSAALAGPDRFKGEMTILRVTPQTATAVLTSTTHEVLPGDRVVSSETAPF